MSNEIDAAYDKAIASLITLHGAASAAEVAEDEILRLRTQNDAIVSVLRERGYKGVDLAADVVALIAYCDGLSAQLADEMDRSKGLDRRDPEPTPDIVRAFKSSNGEWRTHPRGDAVPGSRIAWDSGSAKEASSDSVFCFIPIDLPDDEARRKWVEAAPCWDLPRTARVSVEGVGVADEKEREMTNDDHGDDEGRMNEVPPV